MLVTSKIKKVEIMLLNRLFTYMPPGTAMFVYTKILKPKPLRYIANKLLLLFLPEKISIPEGVLLINKFDPVISGALMLGVYENFELEIFRAILREDMTVLDVGANIGIYSIIAGSKIGIKGNVIACEPEPNNYQLLKRNIETNKLSNVKLFPYALADQEGMMNLYISFENKGAHSLLLEKNKHERKEQISIPVTVRTGDALLQEINIINIDIIKIDVEGAELLVFQGLQNTLRQSSLVIFFEFSPALMNQAKLKPHELFNIISSNGFEIYEMNERKQRLVRIEDINKFLENFDLKSYTNMLCTKGFDNKEIVDKYVA